MNQQTHILKTKERTHRATVTQHPTYVEVALRCSKCGDCLDQDKLKAWLLPIVEPYDADPRPIRFVNPHSGEVATILSDFTIIAP